jgi:hypothetical protein
MDLSEGQGESTIIDANFDAPMEGDQLAEAITEDMSREESQS